MKCSDIFEQNFKWMIIVRIFISLYFYFFSFRICFHWINILTKHGRLRVLKIIWTANKKKILIEKVARFRLMVVFFCCCFRPAQTYAWVHNANLIWLFYFSWWFYVCVFLHFLLYCAARSSHASNNVQVYLIVWISA